MGTLGLNVKTLISDDRNILEHMKMHGLGLRELSWDVYRLFRFCWRQIFLLIQRSVYFHLLAFYFSYTFCFISACCVVLYSVAYVC